MIRITDAFDQHRANVLNYAMRGSAEAAARVAGMKIRGRYAKATPRGMLFPFPGHRTCAQWEGPNRRGKRALKAKR